MNKRTKARPMLDRSGTAPYAEPAQHAHPSEPTAKPRPPSGEVAFLMTDIEGSTRLWDRAPEAMRRALKRHDNIMERAIEAAGGYVFCRAGDSFAAAFDSAESALQAAVSSQRSIAAERWPDVIDLRVRMAIHIGESDERDGNYFGPCLNRCSRLLGLCRGGRIALSGAVRERIGSHVAAVLELTDLGMHGLRDLDEPEHVWFCELGSPANDGKTPECDDYFFERSM